MARKRDLYEILQVDRSVSQEDIKRAYRRLAKKYHPDHNAGNKEAEQRFKDISGAYDVVGDLEKRKLYDEFGEESLRQGFDPAQARAHSRWSQGRGPSGGGPRSAEDIFSGMRGMGGNAFGDGVPFDLEDLLGGMAGRNRGRRTRGRPSPSPDVEQELEVEFLESLQGTERTFTIQNGEGGEARTIRVRIPAGARDGDRVKVAGQAPTTMPGMTPGNLYLKIRIRPHPRLKRIDDDLELSIPITVGEAYLGARIQVPTPDGPIQLTVPPRSQSGTRLRARDRGAPRKSGGRGDLYIRLEVMVPEVESDAIVEAMKVIAGGYARNVREEITL